MWSVRDEHPDDKAAQVARPASESGREDRTGQQVLPEDERRHRDAGSRRAGPGIGARERSALFAVERRRGGHSVDLASKSFKNFCLIQTLKSRPIILPKTIFYNFDIFI